MNETFQLVMYIFQGSLLILLAIPVIYLFFFSVAGLFYKNKSYTDNGIIRKIAILIPGYREDTVIVRIASEALKQNYPSDMYQVVVIADSFLPETISSLNALPVKIIEVVFDKSTKAKALNRAMQKLNTGFDIFVILDADNIMEPDFLSRINTAFNKPLLAVQCHRKAANLDTSLAVLDAISEEINNHIFRRGHRVVGLSSAIIGSGMAFQSDFLRSIMTGSRAVGGFDKEIELKMLKKGIVIEYLDDAIVYDEKVRHEDAFTNQRRRWLSAQLHYMRKNMIPAVKELFLHGNIDYFDKVVQFLLPPRVLLLACVVLFSAVFIPLWLITGYPVIAGLWTLLLLLNFLTFIFSIPLSFYTVKTLKAVTSLPKGIWLMVVSLSRIKGANKTFIHTVHGSTTVKSKS